MNKVIFTITILAWLFTSACDKGSPAIPPDDNSPVIPPDDSPLPDSFWTGKVYKYVSYPPMYPGLKRTNELAFVSDSAFLQTGVNYIDGDSFVEQHYYIFRFDRRSNYLVIAPSNNPPSLSSNLLRYAGDSIIRISRFNNDTIELDTPYLRIK